VGAVPEEVAGCKATRFLVRSGEVVEEALIVPAEVVEP